MVQAGKFAENATHTRRLCRAYLSNRYRRIDNIDIAGVTLPILGGLPDIRFESCQITESRMYIKAVNPRLQARSIPRATLCRPGYHQQQRGRAWIRQHPAADLSAGVQQRYGRE